jgi:hypothetical protein
MRHKVIYIKGIPFKEIQVRIIALLNYAIQVEEAAKCTGYEKSYVDDFIKDIHSKWDVHSPPEQMRKAIDMGFDIYGNLDGVDVLEPRDRKMLLKIRPNLVQHRAATR